MALCSKDTVLEYISSRHSPGSAIFINIGCYPVFFGLFQNNTCVKPVPRLLKSMTTHSIHRATMDMMFDSYDLLIGEAPDPSLPRSLPQGPSVNSKA